MFREDLSRNFGFILHDVARLLRTTFDRRVKSLGLTRSQWWVLNHLFRNDGVTQSELADLLRDREGHARAPARPAGGEGLGAARGRRSRPARQARVPHRGGRARAQGDARRRRRGAPGGAGRAVCRGAGALRRHAARGQDESERRPRTERRATATGRANDERCAPGRKGCDRSARGPRAGCCWSACRSWRS